VNTDWNLIRAVINTAIDSCERLDKLGYVESHRGLTVDVNGHNVSVHEFLISAWTLAENARYQVIRQRHDESKDLPYVPEFARILVSVATACVELIDAGEHPPAADFMNGMINWYRNHFDTYVERAITTHSQKD
jgi:hypothetical protein